MPIQGFPGVDFNIQDQKKVSLAGLFNTVLFLMEMQDGYIQTPIADSGNTGSGTLSADGDVYADMDLVVEITTAGDPGTAVFKYSIDGGSTYTTDVATVSGSAIYLDNGLELTFGGTANAVGDKWTFFTKEGFRKRVITKLTAKDYTSKVTHQTSKEYLDAYFERADECYVIAPPNDSSGSVTDNTGSTTGDGSVVVDGEPSITGNLKFEFTTTGDIGSAEYIYYIDDVQMIGSPVTLTETVYIEEANVTATWTDGTPTSSFAEGDEHIFALEKAGSTNILLALTENISPSTPSLLNNVKTNSKFTNIVVPTPLTTENINKLKYLIDQRQDENNFAGYVLQAPDRGALSTGAYQTLLEGNIEYFSDYRAGICLDYLNTNTIDSPRWTPASIIFASKIANDPVNVDAGNRANGSLTGVISRKDEDNMELIDLALNNAGYIVVRESPDSNGIYGYYFQNSHVLSDEGSAFVNYLDIRTFFKALTIEAYILNGYLKKGIVADDFVLTSIGETVQADTRAVMGAEVSNLTFEVLSTAEEFKTQGYIECRTSVDSLELINKFDVSAGLV